MTTQTSPTLPPAPAPEKPLSREQPVIENRGGPTVPAEQPPLSSQTIGTYEKRLRGEEEEFDQSADVLVAWKAITPNFIDLKPDAIQQLAEKGSEHGNRQYIPSGELPADQALLEYQKFCKFGGEASMENYLKAFPEEFRPPVEQELLGLLRKGQISSELLTAVVAGGIRYAKEPTKLEQGVVPVALYEPGKTGVSPYIELYDKAFDVAEDPRYLLRHELAHSLLMYRGRSLFYRAQDLAAIVNLTTSEPTGSTTPDATKGPTALGQAEAVMLVRALSVGGNPGLVQPFETPYVGGLLNQLAQNPTDHSLRTYILNEMLAERMTAYLSSNGSLADFLLKRINYSGAMQEVPDQAVPDTDPLAGASQEIQMLIMQASIDKMYAGYETLVPRLQEYALRNPALADFIKETIFLHNRFTNGFALNRKLARGHSGSDHASGTLPADNLTAWPEVMETNQMPTKIFDRPGAAAKLPKRKNSWWQAFTRALGTIMHTLGF